LLQAFDPSILWGDGRHCYRSAAEGPVGITVVTAGANDSDRFLDYIEEAGENPGEWQHVDLRKTLKKNPATSVPHKVDAIESDQVKRIVIEQDGFIELIFWLIDTALVVGRRCYYKYFIHCQSGYHRACTVGNFLVMILNYMVIGSNTRVFNAQWFGLHKCISHEAWTSTAAAALSWAKAPWLIAEGVDHRSRVSSRTTCVSAFRIATTPGQRSRTLLHLPCFFLLRPRSRLRSLAISRATERRSRRNGRMQ
jgi:hypothetical protein